MRKLQEILKVGGCAVALVVTTVVSHAQTIPPHNFYLQMDELGNAAVIDANPTLPNPYPLTGAVVTEPLSGIATWRYDASIANQALQTPITSGDLVLLDSTGAISDVIRFRGSLNTSYIYFFSDNADGENDGSLDSGLPATLQANVVTLTEGPVVGGTDGVWYQPTAGQPGYISGAAAAGYVYGYNIISDVPEPSSLVLLGVAGGLALLRKRQ